MLGVYTIVEAADYGWGSARTLVLGRDLDRSAGRLRPPRGIAPRNPLVPLRIFRSRNVSGANGVQILMVAGLFGMFFLGALYLQRVLGYDPIEVGLAFLPASIGIGALSFEISPAPGDALRRSRRCCCPGWPSWPRAWRCSRRCRSTAAT